MSRSLPFDQLCAGLGFSGSMPYFLIASATLIDGILFSSASAFERGNRDEVAIDLEE